MFLFVYVASLGWDCRDLFSLVFFKCAGSVLAIHSLSIFYPGGGGAELGIDRATNRAVLRPVPTL